ncbi:MAG: hypothetical protein VKO00_01030 [Cyanobacteriota bacterium]|nr:hypothetical protein [Cyanobacteriota bacterium]
MIINRLPFLHPEPTVPLQAPFWLRHPSRRALLGLAVGLLAAPTPLWAMASPWWENYDTQERFVCSDRRELVLERNDAQAALLTERHRTTLFREASELPGLRYRNEWMTVILRGDELTLEQLPSRLTCQRTESV